jgi:predicted nucleotidyltransferase component of viral defense system
MAAAVESIQTSPDFRRLLVRRGKESVVVDLVHEFVYQVTKEKRVISGVRVDAPEEILANKLCALLSRSEVRDLVDVRAMERAGYPIENAIDAAVKKDSGFTPAQLAWVLSQIRFGDDLIPPGGVSLADLREFSDELLTRLSRIAFPTA